VVGSFLGQARHRCPRPGCRIPQLARVCWIVRLTIRTLSSPGSAGYQDFAVRKQCSVVEFAPSRHHRSSVFPSGTRTVEVDDLCGCGWVGGTIGRVKSAWASAHEQYLAVVVHHCRSPITSPVIAIPHRAPSTCATNIKVPGRLAGPSTEHFSVGRNKHIRIERQRQVRGGQIAPGARCTLPYLRLDIDTHRRIDPATDREHVSIRQRGARRVPSTVVHIRQPRPGIVQGVIRVGVGQPRPGAYVSPGYQELSIGQKGKARTENVCSYMRSWSIRVRRWIPEAGVVAEVERGPP